MFKIRGEAEGRLGVSQLDIPGVEIEYSCAVCGEHYIESTAEELDYPPVGAPFDYKCFCLDCDHTWYVRVVLGITFAEAIEN